MSVANGIRAVKLGEEEIGLGLKGDSFGTVYAMGQQLECCDLDLNSPCIKS